MVAPFTQPDFGLHARYLLARTHQRADERAEALFHYEGVLADYQKSKVEATALLKTPQKLANNPAERGRLEALLKDPTPDHVARSSFYLGVLLYEGGKFADAKGRFVEFMKLNPQSPLRVEAELRVGFCQVQMREFTEAVKTLAPLTDKDARLSDLVLFWLAKAHVGAAPDAAANPAGYAQAAPIGGRYFSPGSGACPAPSGPGPRGQEPPCFDSVGNGGHLAGTQTAQGSRGRLPTALERKASGRPRRGDWAAPGSRLAPRGRLCRVRQAMRSLPRKISKSALTPGLLFCQAENSYFRALAAAKNPNQSERAKELARLHDETVKRFTMVIERYPEFTRVNVARYSLGLTYYNHGDLEAARKVLGAIPGPERGGDLALVPLLMADCLLRQTPTAIPDDALAAGKLEEQLKSAADLLESFIGSQPNNPAKADAILKFGLCQQRLATLLTQPPEKAKALAAARAAYEKLFAKEFANNPLVPQAYLERAKVMSMSGDINGALNELRRFTNDPLKSSTVAPMAAIQLATLLRGQNKAPEAADILAKTRALHETKQAADPERASWVGLLRYHHGVALREAGKFAEARQVLDSVVKLGLSRPEGAEAALRLGQSLKDEGQQRLDAAHKHLNNPKEIAQAQKLSQEGYQLIKESVGFLESQAEQLKKSEALQEVRARMLYEAAWGNRLLAEPEVKNARAAIALEMHKKLGPAAAKFAPPEVPVEKVPLQAAEKKARGLYQMVIEGFPDLPLASEARFELAELLAQRHEMEPALKLLTDALDKEPSPELTEKIRLHLGSIQAAKGNLKGALAQFDAVAQNPKSPLIGWAHYRAGEAFIQNQQFADAIKRLLVFRDQPPLQNQPGLTDRASCAWACFRPGQGLGRQPAGFGTARQHFPEQSVGRGGALRHGLGATAADQLRRSGEHVHAGHRPHGPRDCRQGSIPDRPLSPRPKTVRGCCQRLARSSVHLRLPGTQRRRPARSGPRLSGREPAGPGAARASAYLA